MSETFLTDVLVVELGGRDAVGVCGSLLAQLGAAVVAVEAGTDDGRVGVSSQARDALAVGKSRARIDPRDPRDRQQLDELLARADAVLVSSDVPGFGLAGLARAARGDAFRCDVTAFGSTGPLAGRPWADWQIQALAGCADTTGDPEGPPMLAGFPVCEMAAGVFAASAVVLALRARRRQGIAQTAEIALYDCAITMLGTFLPGHFAGRRVGRVGNHHVSMSPWNAFRAADGWVLLCAGSNDMWRRVCRVVEQPDLADSPRYATPTERVTLNAEVDALVERWTRRHTVAECVASFNAAGISCGPVCTLDGLAADPSIAHRGMMRSVASERGERDLRVPGTVFRGSRCRGRAADHVPAQGSVAAVLAAVRSDGPGPAPPAGSGEPPLAGLRVIEIGQYTTAPFIARQLGALGADVIKLEGPDGDAARALPPHRDGQGYFFTMGNSDKRCLLLDLRSGEGKETFARLLAQADVFVENLKPGAMARLGFGAEALARINPRLVYCAVSGFGADSPYADRPAMDTTIQAMCGVMDTTQAGGVPYKLGISIADLAGGQLGLLAVIAALEHRDRTGCGQAIDLSMQDAGAWMTHLAWNEPARAADAAIVACADGAVAVAAAGMDVVRGLVPDAAGARLPQTRDGLVHLLDEHGVACAPVLTVNEVAEHAQTAARGMIVAGRSDDGASWPLLASPLRLSATPPAVRRAIGGLGADTVAVLRDWIGTAGAARPAGARAGTG